MPTQRLYISEREVKEAVVQYLKGKNIIVENKGVLHPRFATCKIRNARHYQFDGYYVDEGNYET